MLEEKQRSLCGIVSPAVTGQRAHLISVSMSTLAKAKRKVTVGKVIVDWSTRGRWGSRAQYVPTHQTPFATARYGRNRLIH